MHISKQTKQLLALLLFCIVGAMYFHNEDSIKQSKPLAKGPEKPSAFVEGGQIRVYDDHGTPEFILNSQSALFFDNQNHAIIKHPQISLLQNSNLKPSNSDSKPDVNDTDYAQMTAESGRYDTELEQLLLSGGVLITLPTLNGNTDGIRLESEELLFDKKARFISTDQAVTIHHGNSKLTSIGLNAWIDEKRIELLSQVRGRHVLAQP